MKPDINLPGFRFWHDEYGLPRLRISLWWVWLTGLSAALQALDWVGVL